MAAASPANADTPHGFNATGIMYGLNGYPVDSSNDLAVFKGDMMILEVDGNITENGGSDAHNVGSAESSTVVSSAVKAILAAATAGTVMVHYHPAQIYYAQIDPGAGAVAINYGENMDIAITHAGNTVTGISGMELDESTSAASAALVMSVHGIFNRLDNLIGDHAELRCSVNEHFMNTNVGVGV
jgi:hypothetical protein